MEESTTTLQATFLGPERVEASLVELIVAASEHSEDEYEVADLVDAALATGQLQLRPEPTIGTCSQSQWTASGAQALSAR